MAFLAVSSQPFYVGQDLGSQETTAALKRPSEAPEWQANAQFPSIATSHFAIKPSSVLATFGYSLVAEIPVCPYLQINKQTTNKTPQKPNQHKASKQEGGPNSMPEELSLARAREPHSSALTSGSTTGALPNSSPGHHLDHSQSRGVRTSSQRQTRDHTSPRSSGWTNPDKFSGKPQKMPRKLAQ